MGEEEKEQQKIHDAGKKGGQVAGKAAGKAGKKLGKKLAKHIAKLAIKAGRALATKILANPYSWIVIGIILIVIIVILALTTIFGNVSGGDLDGHGGINEQDEALKQEYQDAADTVFPGVKTESGEELKYRLHWGLIYSVDFYSAETQEVNHEMPYNDLEELAEDLAPVFEYETSTVTITTETEEEKEKELENGETETVTETVTETEEKEVQLLTDADTVKGSYAYSYEWDETTTENDNMKVTVEKKVISGIDFEQDYSRLDAILKDKMDEDTITDDDREMVLHTGETAGTGAPALGFLMGRPTITANSLGGIDISSLPEEWRQAFEDAGGEYNVDPNILMAVAFMESTFRPDAVGPPNPSGELARGMMQFLPSTFDSIGVDGNNDGEKDIFDPIDSIFSAAKYLDYLDISEDAHQALYQYSGGSHEYAEEAIQLSRTVMTSGGGGQLAWPTPTSSNITSTYGTRADPVTGEQSFHNGIDVGASCGTPIVAAASGTVSDSGPASGYGQWIVINHSGGLTTIYGHMYEEDLLVDAGDTVQQGQMISRVGDNGKSTGCHLHFQLEQNKQSVNPMTFLNMSF
ncbi:peptidoglycan DD-metalloendopeptidase family protein [Lentibacillus salinarum]|uniref:Peptidoglycan DD-metalloendopeptidase family protein n=1 Tax=Lentibacillus salinarum TaxID=446820 RepID=A0ABW3ZXG8_9BACI